MEGAQGEGTEEGPGVGMVLAIGAELVFSGRPSVPKQKPQRGEAKEEGWQ
jgi:hypothetical protein